MTDVHIKTLQVLFYKLSPIVSVTAAIIAYLPLIKQSRHIMAAQNVPNLYEPNKTNLIIGDSFSTSANQITFLKNFQLVTRVLMSQKAVEKMFKNVLLQL